MARMPHEPEAFCEAVLTLLNRLSPSRHVELVGTFEMLIDGRHLALENLYRMVLNDPDRGVEIVEQFLDHLMEGEEAANVLLPFDLAKPRIMPRIQPVSIFEHLDRENVAHTEFVNGTVIVYVIDMPHLTVSITTEQMIKWGLQVDDLDTIARENLSKYAPDLQIQLVESFEGGKAAIVAKQDGYDAARLLLHTLYDRLAPELNGDFYVALPARDMFIAVSFQPDAFVHRILERVRTDYRRMPYPICDNFFVVTQDGIAGTREAA